MNAVKLVWALCKVLLAPKIPTWTVQQLLLFDEDTGDLLDASEVCVDHYREDIEELYPDVPRWKLEVRYRYYTSKYRKVLRPCDAVWAFPPVKASGPSNVLLATVYPVGLDISARVRKYHGADHDFGTTTVHDLFPFDDNDWNAHRFESVRIFSLFHGIKVYDFKKNERLVQE